MRITKNVLTHFTNSTKLTQWISQMQKLKLISCAMMLVMVLSACTSTPNVQNPKRIPSKAEAMKAPHDLVKQLNKIIGVSEK
ncbi:lysis system o-spanin lipoprotein Rz1 [Providencia rettgeri]